MRKVSIASLVAGIVLIVLAVAACCYGFCNIDGFRTSYVNAWRIRTTVYRSSNLGMGLVVAGSSLFVSGILLLVLSAITGLKPETVEAKPEPVEVKSEDPKPCCCKEPEVVENPASSESET